MAPSVAPCYSSDMTTTRRANRSRSGPAIPESVHAERGWTRLALRLPPAESEALASLLREGETPGLAIRRLILAASRKSTRPRK